MANKLLSGDAARLLKLSTKTMHNMDADGRLKAERTPSGYRVYDEEDVKRFAKDRDAKKKK